MSDSSNLSFRTKTGFCLITPDDIVLSRSGLRGKMAQSLQGSSSIKKLLLRYVILGLVEITIGVYFLIQASYIIGAFLIFIGGYLLFQTFKSRNNTASPVIQRKAIESIVANPPAPPLKRGYFNVYFYWGDRILNRIIILPGSLQGGVSEFDKALEVFEASGLKITTKAEPQR